MSTLQQRYNDLRVRLRAVRLALQGCFDSSTRVLQRESHALTIARKTSTKPITDFDKNLAVILEHFGIKQREFAGMPARFQKVLRGCVAGEPNRKRYMAKANSLLVLYRIWQWSDGKCYLCNKKKSFKQITADHVFPKSQGYRLNRNSMPACGKCNCEKQDRTPTIAEVQYACEAYEAIGKVFDPSCVETDHDHPWQVFKPIGLDHFDPRGETK